MYNNSRIGVLDSAQLASSSDSSKSNTTFGDSDFDVPSPRKEKKKIVLSERLLACLDKHKVSNRAAMHIITAVAFSFEINIDNFIINYRSLLRPVKNIEQPLQLRSKMISM